MMLWTILLDLCQHQWKQSLKNTDNMASEQQGRMISYYDLSSETVRILISFAARIFYSTFLFQHEILVT
jgi:hypothetical protein